MSSSGMYRIKMKADLLEPIQKYSTTLFLFKLLISSCIPKDSTAFEITDKLVFSRTLDQTTYFHAYRLSFRDCVRICDERVKCKAVVYHRRKLRCGLYGNGLLDNNGDPAATRREKEVVLFARETWATKTGSCGTSTCSGRDSCDTALSQCAITECSLAESVTFSYIGNVQPTGATIIRECNTGLIFPDRTSQQTLECASNGEWTHEQGVKICEPVTCTNTDIPSSPQAVERDSFDLNSKQVIKIVCVYENDHGYTYISPSHLEYVTDLTRFHTRTDHVMLRHRRSFGSQYEGQLSVLSQYSNTYNVTVLANEHTGFSRAAVERAADYGPYILVGLVPLSFGSKNQTTQGYRFNGNDFSFTVCDDNSNNQFVVSVNPSGLPGTFQCSTALSGDVNCAWSNRATRASIDIPDEYFFFNTMLIGGCGGRTSRVEYNYYGINVYINKIAIGLRFDF